MRAGFWHDYTCLRLDMYLRLKPDNEAKQVVKDVVFLDRHLLKTENKMLCFVDR